MQFWIPAVTSTIAARPTTACERATAARRTSALLQSPSLQSPLAVSDSDVAVSSMTCPSIDWPEQFLSLSGADGCVLCSVVLGE